MLRILGVGVVFLLVSTTYSMAQFHRENCHTQGPPFYFEENSKITLATEMDENGCRYGFAPINNNPFHSRNTEMVFEKAVIMKEPTNGNLSQSGEFSFFYKPNKGFRGKDSFVVYICGSSLRGSGCARLTYNATIR